MLLYEFYSQFLGNLYYDKVVIKMCNITFSTYIKSNLLLISQY